MPIDVITGTQAVLMKFVSDALHTADVSLETALGVRIEFLRQRRLPLFNRDSIGGGPVPIVFRLYRAAGGAKVKGWLLLVARLIPKSTNLTPVDSSDQRPLEMLTGGFFNRKALERDIDTAPDAEPIFGSYFPV